jgi:Spy/CpxP family protein refolding chaperone
MKKFFTGIIAIAAFTFSASAQMPSSSDQDVQRTDRRGNNANRINARALEQLNLSESQKEQLKLINDDYRSKMQQVIKSEISADDRKAQRMTLETERKNKVMALLTAEQKEKLKTLLSTQGTDDKGEYKEKTKVDGDKTKIKVKND